MPDPRAQLLGPWLAAALALGGCSQHGEGKASETAKTEASHERPAGKLSGEGPSAPAKADRLPAFSGEAIGAQPGYLEGAVIHGAVELGSLHAFMRGLPLDERGQRDLAEAEQIVPKLRGEDLLARLGLRGDAVLSLSVRPVSTWEAELRELIRQPSATWAELQTWHRHGPDSFEPEPPPEPLEPPLKPPGAQIEPLPPPPPPSPPSAAALDLDRKIKSLGVHVRVDVPVAELAKLRPLLDRLAAELRDDRWSTTCAAVGPAIACGGQSDGVVVIRERSGGIVVDLLLAFVSDFEAPDGPYRRAAILQALSVPSATPPSVAGLRGDFGLALDGPGVSALAETAELASTLRWGRDDFDHFERRAEALAQLRGPDSARVFDGLLIEGRLGPEQLDAAARWRVRPGAKLDGLFELSEIDADVPSLAALCDGALLCGRSRGLPGFSRFDRLATGLYADPERLARTVDRNEELASMVLLLETWPNAIASISRLGPSLGQGPEAYMAQNALAIASRILGFGYSVRSLDNLDRGLRGDWLGYARVTASDLAALTGFLTLAEIPMTPTTIPEVDAAVSFAPIPERDIGGNFYALAEPVSSTGAWGWAVAADADDRVRWLAGLAHDDGAAPLIYFEVSDLWRIVAASRELSEELGWARTWLAQRWIRAQVEHRADAAPVVRLAMGKRG